LVDEWLVVEAFPDYAVSSEGHVKRIVADRKGRPGGILKPHIGRYRQLTLYLSGEPHVVLVHRLVCQAFHGPAPSSRHEVAHCDGNGLNNHRDNLRWATPKENEADKIIHGTSLAGKACNVPVGRRAKGPTHGRHTKPERTARGERNGRSRLTDDMVVEIRLDERPRKQIAASYGVSVTMVGFIQRGLAWAHVARSHGEEGVSE